jgi:hypothetical protein
VGVIHVCHLSLSSVRVHIHSLSTLFVGAVNLAKEVVGSFHLLWFVRALANWWGGGNLPGYFPSLFMGTSLDPRHCHQISVVVELASWLLNPHCGC